jgi:histidine triad (HIT) family protein
MDNCLFCKILKEKIPAAKVFENERVLAFKDIHPQAKIHYLFIHKKHSKDILEMSQDSKQLEEVFEAIHHVAKKERLDSAGFRLVNNCGALAGQTVFHTHFHLLSGEPLGSFGV